MAVIDVLAPWPGRVDEIHVQPGGDVTEGQELVTLESMKMLTPVISEHAGKVTEILAEPDAFVQEGDTLLRLES